MPIECGGVRANENQTRKFTHRDGDDIYEIELTGFREGGRLYKEHSWEANNWPFGKEKRYIGGWGYPVDKGEEKTDSSTGLVVKGS